MSPRAQCPSHTTGAFALNSSGGSPSCTTRTVCLPSVTSNLTPPLVSWTVPGTTAPASRNRDVPWLDRSCTASDTVR